MKGRDFFQSTFVLALTVFAGLSVCPGEEGPTPVTLEKIGAHLGQTVSIEAEIQAISLSSSSGSRYLSFGDAYPRQLLSAKILKTSESLHKRTKPLLGHRVKITGKVESTKAGPEILLLDDSQLQILETPSEESLTKIDEGSAYRARLGATLQSMLKAGDYEGLERLAAKWRSEKTRMLDGRWMLAEFYPALAPEDGEEGTSDTLEHLARWRKARPAAIEPVIARAVASVNEAWEARGKGWASTVTLEGWQTMEKRLEEARATLEGISDRRDECPHWAATMLRVALGQGWTATDYNTLFERAVAREPEYLTYYFRRANWLLPRWYGQPGDWERYSKSFPGAFGVELGARIPWSLVHFHHNIFQDSAVPWEQVKAGFEELLRRYPASNRNKSAYALFAGMAGDRETCRVLLDQLAGSVDMEFWIHWANVEAARQWIADPALPPPGILKPVRN